MNKLSFIFGKSSDWKNFTDREEETNRFKITFNSPINITIVTLRRLGKTFLSHLLPEIIFPSNLQAEISMGEAWRNRTEK
jgi:hypothetical protein